MRVFRLFFCFVKGATFGASCTMDTDCDIPSEECSGSNCACSTGYTHDGNGVCNGVGEVGLYAIIIIIIIPPFEEAGVYCFALVGRSVSRSVDHIFVRSITQKVFQVSS